LAVDRSAGAGADPHRRSPSVHRTGQGAGRGSPAHHHQARAPQCAPAGVRQHHVVRGQRDHLRVDAVVPRAGRSEPGLLGGHAQVRNGHRCGDRWCVVVPATARSGNRARRAQLHVVRPGVGSGVQSEAPGAAMNPVLQLKDVSITYRGSHEPAVSGVSLTLREGETLGLAGESGCGKTSLAMSVLRLLPRTARVEGEILLDGKDVRTMTFGQLRAVRWASASVVFQGAMHALNPVRTIGNQIAEPMKLHGQGGVNPGGGAVDMLELVDLPAARIDAYAHELSGGQRQRVMIAMPLACNPRLVIADEPTTALDVVVQEQILRLLARLVAERGIALMMISHDLSVLSAGCSRLAVMYRGEPVEHGETQQVIGAPKHEHSRALADAFPTVGDPRFRLTDGGSPGSALLSAEGVSVDFTSRA